MTTCPICQTPIHTVLDTGRLSVYCTRACQAKAYRARQRELKAEQAGQQTLFVTPKKRTAPPRTVEHYDSGVVISKRPEQAIFEPKPIIATFDDLLAYFNDTHDKFFNDDAEGKTYVIR